MTDARKIPEMRQMGVKSDRRSSVRVAFAAALVAAFAVVLATAGAFVAVVVAASAVVSEALPVRTSCLLRSTELLRLKSTTKSTVALNAS